MSQQESTPSQEVIDLFVNSSHGDFPKVKELLALHPQILNLPSSAGETALGAAAHTGQKPIALFLLEAGAPLDICTAAMLDKKEEVASMLEADPSLSSAHGSHLIPVMYYAALSGSVEITELLIDNGGDVNGGEGVVTPLHGAIMANKSEMVDWLLAHGASLSAKDYSGKNAHDFAVAYKRQDIADRLLQHAETQGAVALQPN